MMPLTITIIKRHDETKRRANAGKNADSLPIQNSCEKIKATDTFKSGILKKPAISDFASPERSDTLRGEQKIIERTNPFPLHCRLLGCSASFLSRSYNDHSYTTNATMRQDGFKKFIRCGDSVAFVNKTPYMRLDLCCFSITGSLPPLWVTKVYLPDPYPGLLAKGVTT